MALQEKLKRLPSHPGVYLLKSAQGVILYIGKAKELRNRVRSYFQPSTLKTGQRYALRFLAERTAEIDYIVTTNEKEALILEETLLKKHRPRYNIRLKDDKSYLSIKLTMNEEFPRILTTRRVKKDGARYFGPYASASMTRETVKFLRRIFPLCVCSPSEFRNRIRPCLDYQLGICPAPASGLITKEAYAEIVKGAVMFLEGRNRQLIRDLKNKMKEASGRLDFEEAARLRNRINALTATLEEQKVVSKKGTDQDIVASTRGDKTLAVEVLQIRDGRLVAAKDFLFVDTMLPIEEILSSFINQFYRREEFIPDEVVLGTKVPDSAFIAEWLTEKKGKKVKLTKPVRGLKLKLVKMAELNALEALRKKAKEKTAILTDPTGALRTRLRLKSNPERIEAFDISNIGDNHAVGAMVCFVSGRPDKNSYRRYRIKETDTQDDYAMMRELLYRRFSNAKPGLKAPDLILIDGGKGQLSIALRVLKELGLSRLQVIALAKAANAEVGTRTGKRPIPRGGRRPEKGREKVYLPNVKDPVYMKEGLAPDLYLKRIRDEVHRFAIAYHRYLRGKTISSKLSQIPGIGKEREKTLLKHFGDIKSIKEATLTEIAGQKGITEKLARIVKEALNPRKNLS